MREMGNNDAMWIGVVGARVNLRIKQRSSASEKACMPLWSAANFRHTHSLEPASNRLDESQRRTLVWMPKRIWVLRVSKRFHWIERICLEYGVM